MPVRVSVGGVTAAELLVRLEEAGIRLNEYAQGLFHDSRFTTSASVSLVEVVCTTVGELGLAGGGAYAQVLELAQRQGLSVCPLELAPHLRLQWLHQPEAPIAGEPVKHRAPPGSMTVASAAPPDEQEIPWGFYLRRIEGELWLRGYCCWSGHVWSCEDRLVFMRATSAA